MKPLFRSLATVVVALSIWVFYTKNWVSEYQDGPKGDAVYYTAMTYFFYGDRAQTQAIPTIYSKRILGPFLVATWMKLRGFAPQEAVRFEYQYKPFPRDRWSEHQRVSYDQIFSGWKGLNVICLILLAIALGMALPARTPHGAWALWTANLILTPCIVYISVLWPQMQDLLTESLLAGAIVLLIRNHVNFAIAALAVAALAREQVLFLIPLLHWIKPIPKWKWAMAAVPFLIGSFFPLFPNQIPYVDITSKVRGESLWALEAYWGILTYHLGILFSDRGMMQPTAILLTVGGSLLLASFYGLHRDPRIWVIAGLGFVFMADRHMALLNFPLLLLYGTRAKDPSPRGAPVILTVLASLVLFKVYWISQLGRAFWLQVEHWFRVMDRPTFIGLGLVLSIGIAVLSAWTYRLPVSAAASPKKTRRAA